jgi:carboxylesterase
MENNNFKKYNIFLRGADKAVLLIHGITGTPSEMCYLGRVLHKAGYTVICNTLPHHCATLNELKKVSWQEIFDACVNDLNFLKKEYRCIFVGGISMGALMAIHLAYKFPADITGIIALSPTLFYDGWAIHKGQVLMPLVWHLPFLRNMINIKEDWPYGLKDETLRENIHRVYAKAIKNKSNGDRVLFGSPFFPLACLYQHTLFTKIVKKEIPSVKTPILIIHAKEDDMTSIKNANYIFRNIASSKKSLVILEDSYHMITIDREKDKVAQETINFLVKL